MYPGPPHAADDASAPPVPGAPLVDRLARPLGDLRLSVTDRCNLRCTYCMPRAHFPTDAPFLPRAELLTFEELARVASVCVSLGARKVHLTGGEPLLRRGLPALVRLLAPLGVDLALTTNGWLLAEHARALREAGLRRLTVSLDALDEPTFRRMADVQGSPERVLRGIAAAETAGFDPPKINCVVRRDVNPHAPRELVRHFLGSRRELRFIELMDVGGTNGWRPELVVPWRELAAELGKEHRLVPLPPRRTGEVARRFALEGHSLELGFITSITEPFCRGCTRLRVTADGKLFSCLFAHEGVDLRGPLRAGATDEDLSSLVAGFWARREDRWSELRASRRPDTPHAEMSYLGG